MPEKEELRSALRRLLQNYPEFMVAQGIKGDSFTVMKKPIPGADEDEDIVGVYTIDAWKDGSLTEEDITSDIQEYFK